MWLSKKDSNGNKFYINAFTGRKERPLRISGKHKSKLPNYVFASFRNPQPIGVNRSEKLIK